MSALVSCPQLRHLKTAWLTRLPASTCPRSEQRWLVWWVGTGTNCRPYQSDLYSSFWRVPYQPWARIERFNPDFCFTFLPGCSTVPLAGHGPRLAGGVRVAGCCSRLLLEGVQSFYDPFDYLGAQAGF